METWKIKRVFNPRYDNFNLRESHFIPGIMHRWYLQKEENDKISLDITEDPLEEKTQDTAVENEKELETIEDIESVLSTPQEDKFPFDIELEDLTSSLQDDGAVYGLLEPEDTNTDIKEEVNNELKNLIESQENNIKKVKVTEEPSEVDVTVTKINNPEYNFFMDAATTLK